MAATAARTKPAAACRVGPKYVYDFEEGNAGMRALLGGKGAGVAEMTNAGLPVPPGFTITTEACNAYMQAANKFPAGLMDEVKQHLSKLEQRTGKRLGDPDEPLLVSVRSGAAQSMPGMMDTVLNLGLNQRSLEGLAKKTGDRRFALDAYRRFIQLFGRIVKGVEGELFEHELEAAKAAAKVSSDAELSAAALTKLAEKFREIYRSQTKEPFPEDPWEQLTMAIAAVFSSWNGRRAVAYREYNHIPHNLGTAVNVQAMVFGNMGNDSRHRGGLHPGPGDRGESPLRRVSDQRPGRGRGGRYPHPPAPAGTAHRHAGQSTGIREDRAAIWKITTGRCRTSSSPSSGAGSTCCRPGNAKMNAGPCARPRWTWRRKDSLTRRRPCCGWSRAWWSSSCTGASTPMPRSSPGSGHSASPGAATGKVVFDADRAERLGKEG